MGDGPSGLECLRAPTLNEVSDLGYTLGMAALEQSLEQLRRFGEAMATTTPVDVALRETRELLRAARVPFKLVSGVAVHHHGYERFTRDVGVLVDAGAVPALDAALSAHGFRRESPSRLTHLSTGVRVDVLVSGVPLARRPAHRFPRPEDVPGSQRDSEVVALAPLLELKLLAGRAQDVADVVQLLKEVDDAAYVYLEADVMATLRPELAGLRDDALEELRWDGY